MGWVEAAEVLHPEGVCPWSIARASPRTATGSFSSNALPRKLIEQRRHGLPRRLDHVLREHSPVQ